MVFFHCLNTNKMKTPTKQKTKRKKNINKNMKSVLLLYELPKIMHTHTQFFLCSHLSLIQLAVH